MDDPSEIRLSENFLLSDFLGNHSVYNYGYANGLVGDVKFKLENARALCSEILEHVLAKYGPLSVSYGYISPSLSERIVKYQDPGKPSHHRWDLGAAADICVHEWVNSNPDDDTIHTAPVALAHNIDADGTRYSRIITYAESPYICVAAMASELDLDAPRKAFYENRYVGVDKPLYRSMATATARAAGLAAAGEYINANGWRGQGHPSYHGGGKRQYQHIRTSKYTMLSDWLIDLQSIANGERNRPGLQNEKLVQTFYAVGDAYDEILDKASINRMSIIAAYVSPNNSSFDAANDWRTGKATFTIVPPESKTIKDIVMAILFCKDSHITGFREDGDRLHITVEL